MTTESCSSKNGQNRRTEKGKPPGQLARGFVLKEADYSATIITASLVMVVVSLAKVTVTSNL